MTNRAAYSHWVEIWRRAGRELELLRRREIATCDTAQAIRHMEDAFAAAERLNPPTSTSGLVELQRWLRRMPGGPRSEC